jgi:hypothetical protein
MTVYPVYVLLLIATVRRAIRSQLVGSITTSARGAQLAADQLTDKDAVRCLRRHSSPSSWIMTPAVLLQSFLQSYEAG